MSLRLSLLNLFLRLTVKPALRRMRAPQAARKHLERSAARLRRFLPPMRITEDLVQGPGGPVPVEWVASEGADRRTVILYLHGGAYIMGSPRTHRSITSALAQASNARVIAPDYRLAPEHPAPAAVEDAVAVYSWLLKQGYASRRVFLAGESAGGGLCFAALLKLQEMRFEPPAGIIAFSPWADLTMSGASLKENAHADPMLPVERFEETAGYYIGPGDAADPLISPLLGAFLPPPPVQLFVGETEIIRDDSLRMAEKLRDAGGRVDLRRHPAAPHAWPFFAPLVPESRQAIEEAAEFIRAQTATCA